MSAPHLIAPSRRNVIASGAASLFGASLLHAGPQPVRHGRPLRIAHLTDMHVKPEARAGEGYAMALDSLRKLDPAADILVTGGDHVMDVMQSTKQRAIVQWDLYDKVLAAGTKLPVHPVMGNHDVFGWGSKEPLDETAPDYGKAMALDRLKLKQSYYSFDAGAWHIVVLDNIARRGGGYFSLLDPQQLEWLVADLKANNSARPVCVFSHVPFFAICPFFFNPRTEVLWRVRDNLLYHDLSTILPVFKRGNVKLAVSGHIHMGDRIEFDGMTFITEPAVSGNWWGGPHQDFAEGYGVIDLWPDGSFEHRYLTYGWKVSK
jgi:3',5'-cyclic AMP phosphodiesterase CpdA